MHRYRFRLFTRRASTRRGRHAIFDALEPRRLLAASIGLNPPTNLAVTIGYREAPDGGTTRAHLTWTDTNSDETAYRVESSSDNGFIWNLIGPDLLANSTSANHVLDAGQKLSYRVTAMKGQVVSEPSEAASPITPVDRVVQVSANVSSNTVYLKWPYDPDAVSYDVYRKPRNGSTWTLRTPTPLAANNVGWGETVAQGEAYEYRIERQTRNFYGTLDGTAFGYVYAGNRVPLNDSRGRVLLVVDQTRVSAIAAELLRYRRDLVSDGWTVEQIVVSRDNGDARQAISVRGQIQAAALAQTAPLKSIVLIGHVPVPYSGTTAWDGHTDHSGAWPADGFYGALGSLSGWSDSLISLNPTNPDNNNLPGDGKFDQDNMPNPITVPVGRIDFANLAGMRFSFVNPIPPTVDESESALLRRYFDKNHAWRTRDTQVMNTAIEDDHLGGGAAENGWRNFAPLVGDLQTRPAEFQTTLGDTTNLWSAGIGPGSNEYALGVVGATQLHSPDVSVFSVFNLLSGSWFGDWNKPTNLMREIVAANGTSLAAVWAGTPNLFLHTMGLGETIGQAMMLSQNNTLTSPYAPPSSGARGTHMGLIGDPTLTMAIAPPVTSLTSSRTDNRNSISWNAPTDGSVTAFNVYRADNADGPFYRIGTAIPTAGPGTTMTFTDPTPLVTYKKFTYMVRAIKMTTTPSGKYENASWGETVQSKTTNGGEPAKPIQATRTSSTSVAAPVPPVPSIFSDQSLAGLQANPLDDLGL